MKLAPGVFWREIKYLITSVQYQLASTKSAMRAKTWVTILDNIPLKMSRNSSTIITVHSVNSFEKSLSLLSVSSNETGPSSSVGRVSTSRNGRTLVRPQAATYQSRKNGTSCSSQFMDLSLPYLFTLGSFATFHWIIRYPVFFAPFRP